MQVLYLELAARWLSWRAESVKKKLFRVKKIFHTKKNIQVCSWFQDFIARNTVVQSDFNYDIWFWKYNCVVPWLIGTHVTPNSPPFITPTLDCLMHSYLWKDTILAWLCTRQADVWQILKIFQSPNKIDQNFSHVINSTARPCSVICDLFRAENNRYNTRNS